MEWKSIFAISFSAAHGVKKVCLRTCVCYAEIFAESCGQRIILFVCQAGDVYLRVLKAQVSSHRSSQGLAVLTGCD